MTKFTFIDIEAAWDEHLHEAYRQIDPVGAGAQTRDGHHRRRQACKRIIAAAAFDLEIDAQGAISIGGLSSWTAYDHGDEREVVAALLEHLRGRPDRHVVTYAGLAAELPLLNLAAMEYGLVLPHQLRSGAADRHGRSAWRPHIDLALELKGQGREWAHLSEIGLRLGLPGVLFAGKPKIEMPTTSEEWQTMRSRVAMDCVLTAMIALSFWRVHGRIVLDQSAMLHNIASWCQRTGIASSSQEAAIASLQQQAMAAMAEDLVVPV